MVKAAFETIDLELHSGTHPRLGSLLVQNLSFLKFQFKKVPRVQQRLKVKQLS
ncbi:hypothetical protein ACS0TY_035231 [Phlomoides rotata]